MAVATQRVRSPFQIDRVPQHDGSRYQIEAASPVALLLETAVADFTRRLKNTALASALRASPLFRPACTRRRSSTLCSQSRMNSVRSMRPSSRGAPRPGRSGVGSCRAFEHQGGRHRALLDRGGQPQDFVPMGADVLDVERAADHGVSARVIGGVALRDVELGVAQVADARREAEAQEVHQGEDVIGEARRVGVMLLDPQVGLVVQQAVEHVGRIAHADVHDLGVKWRVLVRNVGVERPPWAAPVFRVDVAGALGLAAGARKFWPSDDEGGAVAPVLGEGMAELCVDQIGQRRPVGFVADVPGLQPCQLGVGRAGARLRHLGQAPG